MPSFLGLPELGLLLVILLLLFGPGKLPQVAKAIGESIQQFKKSTTGGAESVAANNTAAVSTAPQPEVLATANHVNTPQSTTTETTNLHH